MQEILDHIACQKENGSIELPSSNSNLTSFQKGNDFTDPQGSSSILGAILSFIIKKISELLGLSDGLLRLIQSQSPINNPAHAAEQENRAMEHDPLEQIKILVKENAELRKEKNKVIKENRQLKKQLAQNAEIQRNEPQKVQISPKTLENCTFKNFLKHPKNHNCLTWRFFSAL
ncbi:hypothetical protein [Helicobacter gastrofelis]|nr:hypothetical protein [Helicobacter sp. NHP19-012]